MNIYDKKNIDPAIVGLSSRTVIKAISNKEIALIKDRKSRIIMKDGANILQEVKAIQNEYPTKKINLYTNAPVCSKTIAFLSENEILVKPLQ